MKSPILYSALSLVIAAVSSGSAPAKAPADKPTQKVQGDYVEVRTASVFGCACPGASRANSQNITAIRATGTR